MEYIHYIFYQSFKRRRKRGARARASLPPLCQSVHCPSGGKTKPPSVFLALSHTQVYTHLSAPFITSGGFQAHVSSDLPPESASRVRWAAWSPLRGRRARGECGNNPRPGSLLGGAILPLLPLSLPASEGRLGGRACTSLTCCSFSRIIVSTSITIKNTLFESQVSVFRRAYVLPRNLLPRLPSCQCL